MIEINGLYFDIKITKKRMRNMYMRLNGNTITISAPKYVSDREIYSFINDRKDWIYETYFKEIIKDNTSYKYHRGNIFYIFGERYELIFNIGRSKYSINDKKIYLTYKENDQEKAINYLYKCLNSELLKEAEIFRDKYLILLRDYGYNEIPIINARILKSKWGVCYTRDNKINISSYLIHYPKECLDYILLHEMTHFIIPNHSKRFYDIVSRYMPNYKEVQNSLKH